MGAACCRCVQPASMQPRKTYNTLVGQLFNVLPIKTDDAIDSTMRRKIQKLHEYLQVNPAKVPKASRRLMRRIKATLRKPGDNLGHVKIAVHTYAYLLARSADESSSYGPSFFLKELLMGQDAVVPLLLRDMHIEMRTLGAELLAVFTRVQSPVDSKLDAIQAHVLQVCRVAQGALRSDRKEQKLQETAERRRAGDKLAVPDPIYLIGRRDPAHVAALEASCLHCLQEVVVLCRKNKVVPAQIHEIQAVMLDNLSASRSGPGGAAAAAVAATDGAAAAAAVPQGVVDTGFYSAMGMQQFLPHGSQPKEQARELLVEMASFTQDIAMVDKILDSFYDYMDDRDRWHEAGVVKNFLAALGAGAGQHPYPIYASLLRHACSSKLSVPDCTAVLRVAKDQGVQLDEAYSLSALQLALEEMPRAWAEQARQDPKTMLMKPFLDLWRAGTAAVKDLAHIGESPTPGQHPGTAAQGSSQGSTPRASNSIQQQQPSAGGAAPGSEHAGTVRQQLAELKLTMLQTVQALAGRVQTGAELCEVVTGVLHAVTADLRCPGQHSPVRLSSSGDVAAAAAAAAAAAGGAHGPVFANGPSGAFSGSPFEVAAAGPATASFLGTAASRDGGAAPMSVADAATLATAGMALQLAAAAAEGCVGERDGAFVTPLSSSTTGPYAVYSTDGVGSSRGLPGGMLPSRLVSAALPLLTQGPPVVQHAVQHILLTLLPAAPQGVASPQQAAQLADAVLAEVPHLQSPAAAAGAADAAAHDDTHTPVLVSGVDALLRCCLKGGQQAPPGAVLAVARAVLQQQAQWVEQQGYRSNGSSSGSATTQHALVLLHNSQLAALADAAKSRSLLSHQLPLGPHAHPSLQLTPLGLLAAGTSSATAAQPAAVSSAALQALEQQHPPSQQHVADLRAALLQVPVLSEHYAGQLPALLDSQLPPRFSSTTGSETDRRDRTQLAGKVSAQLPERKATFSKGRLVHVSDLLQRNSMTRSQNLPPVTSFLDARSSARGAAAVAPAAAAAEHSVTSTSTAGSGPIAPAAQISPAAAAAVATAAAAGTAAGGLPTVSVIAAGVPDKAAGVQQRLAPVSSGDVQLEVAAGAQGHSGRGKAAPVSLTSAVAAVLQQPAPAGTYVVRDIQISRLAGELDAQL